MQKLQTDQTGPVEDNWNSRSSTWLHDPSSQPAIFLPESHAIFAEIPKPKGFPACARMSGPRGGESNSVSVKGNLCWIAIRLASGSNIGRWIVFEYFQFDRSEPNCILDGLFHEGINIVVAHGFLRKMIRDRGQFILVKLPFQANFHLCLLCQPLLPWVPERLRDTTRLDSAEDQL